MRTRHTEVKILPYDRRFIYNIVADVQRYPQFIPWINRVRVLDSYDNIVEFEMNVDFKVVKEKFSTKDTFWQDEFIEISLISGPFSYLYNTWKFESIDDYTTKVTFFIDFDFKSKLLGALFSNVFVQAQKKIIDAFDKRAESLYRKQVR
ncbi:MAG: type II toxin-antitoxin system RatA family toxin [Alphaproteobacteria bacterium]|jgi:coenzyme Q-binding protein COQ10|nr:type II toxin-antitoxin system RatA family toxin [Alphaproteobacteria bacterium]